LTNCLEVGTLCSHRGGYPRRMYQIIGPREACPGATRSGYPPFRLIDFKCVYRSLIYAPHSVLWRRVARLLDALRYVSPWHPRCLFSLSCCFSRCYLLSFSVYSAALFRRPLLWGALFPIATGVGPRRQRMLRCRSSSDPPVRLRRGEWHSGASLALSPLASLSSSFSLSLRLRFFAKVQ
jgi:hypothetical protein